MSNLDLTRLGKIQDHKIQRESRFYNQTLIQLNCA